MNKLPINISSWFGSLDSLIDSLYNNKVLDINDSSLDGLLNDLLKTNLTIWQYEDQARRIDVNDAVIANVKRNIDKFNQIRHNIINTMDAFIREDIEKNIPNIPKDTPLNSEAPGSIFDRLMVLALRSYHLKKELGRKDASEPHKKRCLGMLEEVKARSIDLLKCLEVLMDDYYGGKKKLKSYKEHKLYNDPELNPALRKKS
ncbi:MAG: DUF4254 domain-containing protein [Candidatus Omnitrophota bacterium]